MRGRCTVAVHLLLSKGEGLKGHRGTGSRCAAGGRSKGASDSPTARENLVSQYLWTAAY